MPHQRDERNHFTPEIYRELLVRAQRSGYRFLRVSDLRRPLPPAPRLLMLRHDIDVSPLCALEMAKIEHSLGIPSSFFVLLHSPFYNPAAPPHIDALLEIAEMGFELGLHYEVDYHEKRGRDPFEGVVGDARALGHILGRQVVSISQHRPASEPLVERLSKRFVDAYSARVMGALRYISDSGFRWREASLGELVGVEPRIHALLHPATWAFDLGLAETYRRCSLWHGELMEQAFDAFLESTRIYLHRRERLDRERRRHYRTPPHERGTPRPVEAPAARRPEGPAPG